MAPRRDTPPRPPEAGPNWVYNPELGRWTPPDAAQPPPATPAPTTATPTNTGTGDPGGAPQYEQPPTNVDDNTLAAWLQQHAIDMDAEISRLSDAEDAAALALQTALASGDPEMVRGATPGVQAANQRLKAAQSAQAGYLAQLQPVQARLDKVAARNDPQAQEERQARMLALQSQIDANAAQQRLADARLKSEMNPFDKIAARALQDAQTKSDLATADYTQKRADAYPEESKAAIKSSNASADVNSAQAKQIQALIDAGMPEAQAKQAVASAHESQAQADQIAALIAAGMPAAQAAATVAQGHASESAAAVNNLDLHQKQIGELGTYAEQLQTQVDAGVLTRDKARAMLQAKSDELATGATSYTRQQQTAANSLAFARDAMQQGALQPLGQPSAAGAAYNELGAQMGYGALPVAPVQPIPQAIQALGADVNTPYTTAQLGMPQQPNLPNGGPTSADSFTYSPAVQAGAGQQAPAAPPPAVQGLGHAQVDWTALTFQQIKTLLEGGGQAATPQQPPVQAVPVVNGGGAAAPAVAMPGRR